jgi:DNA-binding NtrC family response regulator
MDLMRVVHVEDDGSHREIIKILLEKNNKIEVISLDSAEKALKLLEENKVDCIISDYQMPGMDGLTFAKIVKERFNIPFILYTGHGSEKIAEKAFANRVDFYLIKELGLSQYLLLEKQILYFVQKYRTEVHYRKLVEASKKTSS